MPAVSTFVEQVIDEAIDEATGTSSKKWALMLVVFVAGATVAMWLTRRSRSAETPTLGPEVEKT